MSREKSRRDAQSIPFLMDTFWFFLRHDIRSIETITHVSIRDKLAQVNTNSQCLSEDRGYTGCRRELQATTEGNKYSRGTGMTIQVDLGISRAWPFRPVSVRYSPKETAGSVVSVEISAPSTCGSVWSCPRVFVRKMVSNAWGHLAYGTHSHHRGLATQGFIVGVESAPEAKPAANIVSGSPISSAFYYRGP